MIDESTTFAALLRDIAHLSGLSDDAAGLPTLEPGSELGEGRFVVERLIGRGGMGVVYQALDREHDLRVALKTLRVVRAELLVRFRREFRALQQVTHPNLIRPLELLGSGEDWFFTMELVEGVNFESYVGSDVERMRTMLGQLASALEAVHRAGLVHRDVKPSNIIVTGHGRLALLDLGLVLDARQSSWLDDGAVGTRMYMAPELKDSRAATPAADWYAVGVMVRRFLERRDASIEPERIAELTDLAESLLQPDPAARAGIEAIASCTSSAQEAAASAVEVGADASGVVGREASLAKLEAVLLSAVQTRTARVAYVHGPSGIGKSTLLACFAQSQQHRAQVLRGNCYEQESVPFKGLDGVVEDLTSRLMALGPNATEHLHPKQAKLLSQAFPVLSGLSGMKSAEDSQGGSVRQLAAALRTLLAVLARLSPLLLIIDDFQWADADARSLLDNLLSAEGQLPLMLVIGSREEAPPQFGLSLEDVALEPLSVDASRLLAQRLLGKDSLEADVQVLTNESGGHPLYLAELARHATRERLAGRPPRLDEALVERTRHLDAPSMRLLELVALAAAPLQREVLSRASGLGGATFVHTMEQLRREGWTVSSGPGNQAWVGAFHDRAREVLRARVSGENLKTMHRQLAVAMTSVTPDAYDRLAFHYRAAGDDALAYDASLLAARRAEQALAFDSAAQLYRGALELGPIPGGRIAEALGQSLVAANRPLDAAAAFRRATDGESDGARVRGLLARAAGQLLAGGEVRAGMTQLYDVLESLGLKAPRTQAQAIRALVGSRLSLRFLGPWWSRARPLAPTEAVLERIDLLHTAGTALLLVDGLRGVPFHVQSLFLARRCGDRFRLARGLAMESCRQSTSGGLERAERAASEALELSEGLAAPRIRYMHRAARAVGAFRRGAWADTIREHDEGASDRDELRGTPWELSSALLYAQLARFQAGQLNEWRRQVSLGADEARRRRDNNLALCVDISGGVLAPLMDGEETEACRVLADVEARLWEGTGFMRIVAYLLRAWLSLYANDLTGARQVVLHGYGRPEVRFVSRELHYTGSWLTYLEASLDLLQSPTRRRTSRRVIQAAQALEAGAWWTRPLGSLLRARCLMASGDRDGGLRALEQVVAEARTGGHHLLAGAAAVAQEVWASATPPADETLRQHLDVARPIQFAQMFVPGISSLPA